MSTLKRGAPIRSGAFVIFLCLVLWHSDGKAGMPMDADNFSVERYEVALRPDLTTTSISGAEKIVLRATGHNVAQLIFSPNALKVERAMLDGRPIQVASEDDGTVFTLAVPLQKGRRYTLQFNFEGLPKRGLTATVAGAHTSYFACDWMVCRQDVPAEKAHFELDLFLPAGIQTVGNGKALPVRPLPNGETLHRWRSTRRYSAYLYGFAAGSFDQTRVKTPQGELAYVNATGEQADLSALFAQAPDIAEFLSEKAGLPLPDFRFTQVLVSGRDAQEAAGYALIGKTELDRERGDPSLAWIISHEMAHQWWGNLVTCATWQDFWLNEGMATFMTAAWHEHRAGPTAYAKELDVARRRLAQARASGFDKPLSWPGKYPNLSLRRAVQYNKGALFLAELRNIMGDDDFWEGIRRYTRRHAGGTATSRDFQNVMEAAAGRSLAAMFAEWVYFNADHGPDEG